MIVNTNKKKIVKTAITLLDIVHVFVYFLPLNIEHSKGKIFQMSRPSERRHSSSSKPPSSYAASAAFAISRNKGSVGGGVGGGAVSGSTLARPSSTNSSIPTKIYKPTKEKLPHRKPHFPYRVLQEERCVCVCFDGV